MFIKEKLEDAIRVTRSRNLKKDRKCNGLKKKNKGQITIAQSLHRNLKMEQHEPHSISWVNSCVPER
jgi:hypothetical protein